ncbi:4-aminobutyrate--2-oxoglutarate transaminase [Azospirillum sp. RWY-5-1]|uniref:4-aminobutyrate--2-oxoglutarate transaminase n=1 Tax=Azospirillum oleiclasticum TaxID=2735135 RepID=A0ABX2TJE7_9PROT|nr:4-aminobutyrate--2-oxoglutarate transaminase [Azospirillum oleiclasticum]NYZ14361.1 4-aminobutyrate--2-oxoglutarate transaminase [Azospirillum oleiclasticum]NYZ23287.1 4-aminobutyrate--2-oxoglutarate transaminase [Azospirillum oleiclasticum]
MTTNALLLARRLNAVPRGVATATPVFAARAENAQIWDVEGNRYIDFAAGIAVLNTGHRHPAVMRAVAEQSARFTHTAFQVMAYEPYVALAERINALVPIAGPAKTILFTTGAKALENAVKIARAATGRSGIIAFTGGFHGRTMMTMAMTGKVAPYKKAFGPLPGDVHHVPFPVASRGIAVADSLRALDFLFAADLEPERVAAIAIEPVQGEGGFHAALPELMTALRLLCDHHGIMLIVDEVQTGFARTGRMFASEHFQPVRPDLITMAKSLAGGFPLSGVVGRADVMDAAEPGGLGGTYAGNPVACAAALAVLDTIEAEGLCARAEAIGTRLTARLEKMRTRNDLVPITAPRGLGAMIAFDVVKDRSGNDPDPEVARAVVRRAMAEGLILLNCGTDGSGVRILAPLTADDAILDEGMDRLEAALAHAA